MGISPKKIRGKKDNLLKVVSTEKAIAEKLRNEVPEAARGIFPTRGDDLFGICDLIETDVKTDRDAYLVVIGWKFLEAQQKLHWGKLYGAIKSMEAESARGKRPPKMPTIVFLHLISQELSNAEIKQRLYGGTDVGDVSWKVPTAGMSAATWVPGTSAHTWQAVAAGGTSIGIKGMLIAAKTIALTAQDVFTDPDLIIRANKELEERIGKNDPYKALIGDRDPPLDYRN